MKENKKVVDIFNRFPKKRSNLPQEYRKIFKEAYKDNRDGIGLLGALKVKLENWMHHKVANLPKERILEVGAGTLNHIKFENNFKIYDVIEPMNFLYKNSKAIKSVDNIYKTSEEIKNNTYYTNIISIAVFEHMTNLPLELTKLVKMLDKDGTFQVAIPSEGALFWYLSWRLVTGSSFYLKHKLDYKIFMKHEHLNDCDEIETLIGYLFNNVQISRFPFNLFHLSFYTYIEARDINIEALKSLETLNIQ